MSWADWRDANPDGLVLSRDTGHDRDYGSNLYPGYDDADSSPFLYEGEVDGRLAAVERVVAVESDGDAVAIRLDVLSDEGVVRSTSMASHTPCGPSPAPPRRSMTSPSRG